jgi:ABC-type dipeptide/oligopeptide/nickel transport system permease subunit
MTQGIEDIVSGGDPFQFTEEPTDERARVEGRSPFQLAFARLRRDRGAMISLGVVITIILVAIFAPVFKTITGHPPNQQYYGPDAKNPVTTLPVGPNSHFWLGTDQAGRDVLVRIAYGARVSLAVGLGATALTIIIGVIAGLLSGFFGGVTDTVIARIIDVVLAIPYLLFAIALIAVIGHVGVGLLIVIIALFGWASVARIIRGQVISLREREFIEAARSLGASNWRIMFVDILPNVIAPAIVFATLLIPVSVVTEASLSYLGIGIQPPTADWGEMINDATNSNLYQVAWWFLLFPGLALLATTLSFNILGDGVRDAFDPRSDRLIPPKKKKKGKNKDKDKDKDKAMATEMAST